MKKETTNTFQKGMIKDLHPLTTPNDVLTDALNGTLITYNGNEGALQNDMGNVKIKNALLKAGYVPVGMKEHGGIIYVAAYNPTTGKGQVGSFPSPKQLWENEDWDINKPADIYTSVSIQNDIYNGDFIINEVVKQAIFTTTDGKARIFHPGDKFIIGFPAKSNLSSYVNLGYLEIQLGVIKSDGGIEIMKTWSKDSSGDFLYDGSSNLSSLLNTSSAQVFDASSSGEMILIVKLNTLDSFNLIREYSLTQDDKIKVTFKGEATRNNETLSSSGGFLGLSTGSSSYDNNTIEVVEGSGNIPTMIYPNVPFGIIQRMGRSVSINFDKIRKTQDEFGEWRFFVTEKYVKIGWSYDFYNLDGSKQIEYIRMYFHKLEDGPNPGEGVTVPYIDFQKESYNGNFEEYINYSDIGLAYKHVYIVEIVRKLTGDKEQTIDFKMLYLSTLYNDKYNGFFVNNSIGLAGEDAQENSQSLEYEPVPNQSIDIKLSPSLETELIGSNATINCPDETTYEVPTVDVKARMFTTPTSELDLSQLDSYQYLTSIVNEYKNKLSILGQLEEIEDKYIGKPRKSLVEDLLKTYRISSIEIERDDKEWVPSSSLKPFNNIEAINHSEDYEENNVKKEYVADAETTVTDNTLTLDNIKFKDDRFMQGLVSEVKHATYWSKGLSPLYSPKYSLDKRNKIAPYWNTEETLCISGAGDGDNTTMHYNSRIMPAGYVVEGPDAGGGCDDGGLFTASNYMGRPLTNIFSGNHGEDAELCFDNLRENTTATTSDKLNIISGSGENGGQFIDYQGDNYLVACWKFTDGDSRFVNLVTRRDVPAKSSIAWPRLDVMLKCILSQIFIVNRIQKSVDYITTNDRFYRYEQGTTKIKVTLSQGENPDLSSLKDILVLEVEGEEKSLNWYFEKKWNNGSLEKNNKTYTITNLIPTIDVTNPTITEPFELELPNLYDLDVLIGYYLGATYNQLEDNSSDLDVKAIYMPDTSQAAFNASVCAKKKGQGDSAKPEANPDGAYEWNDTPKYKKLTSTDKNLVIYRWNDASNITFKDFYLYFTTKAQELGWDDVQEDDENEVLAKTSNVSTQGKWTDAADEHAPDMYYKTLYSYDISAFNDHT